MWKIAAGLAARAAAPVGKPRQAASRRPPYRAAGSVSAPQLAPPTSWSPQATPTHLANPACSYTRRWLIVATLLGGLLFHGAGSPLASPAVPGPAGPPVPAALVPLLAYAPCVPTGATATDAAIANQVRPQMNGPQMGRTVSPYQVSCARIITETTRSRGLPTRAAVIAVTTAITESSLHNYTQANDHDSLGLFQQRPSQGWGTPAQITNPVYATNAFLNAMLHKYPNNSWMSGDIGAICQAVQVSAVPDAYARGVHDAQLLVNALWGGPGSRRSGDFDGDGRADMALFRPSSGTWYVRNSSTTVTYAVGNWSTSGDVPV